MFAFIFNAKSLTLYRRERYKQRQVGHGAACSGLVKKGRIYNARSRSASAFASPQQSLFQTGKIPYTRIISHCRLFDNSPTHQPLLSFSKCILFSKSGQGYIFKSSVLAHVHFDSYEAFQMTSKLLLNIQDKVSLISPTAVVNLTRKTVLCKYSLVEKKKYF